MHHITLRSEYSFKQCYGFLKELHDNYSHNNVIGIADTNTFGYYKLYDACKKSGKKAIYGYRCTVVKDATETVKPRGQFGREYIIIARNYSGLQEIFKLTSISTNNFYYRGNISVSDIDSLSENVYVISTDPITDRLDFIGVNHTTRPKVLGYDFPKVYIENNYFTTPEMRKIYELIAGNSSENKTYPQHILCLEEIRGFGSECIDNMQVIVDGCENIELRKAENIRYKGEEKIGDLCIAGAIKKNVDLTDEEYRLRYEREINLIEGKGYTDYLMVVADLIISAKKFCLVGPGRGCFLPDSMVQLIDCYKNINEVKIGDTVLDAYGEEQLCTGVFEYDCDEYIIEFETFDGNLIRCTKDHKILTNNRGFVEAGSLTFDDEIVINEI